MAQFLRLADFCTSVHFNPVAGRFPSNQDIIGFTGYLPGYDSPKTGKLFF